MILVGDKNAFALECIIGDAIEKVGRVFIYVDGNRFGQDDFDEELIAFFFNAIRGSFFDNIFPDLMKMSPVEYIKFMNCIYSEFSGDECERYLAFKFDAEKIESGVVFLAPYAFDKVFISVVSDGVREKVFIKDKVSGVMAEVEQERGHFADTLLAFASEVDGTIDWHAINAHSQKVAVLGN